jgi:tungstate transport system ATP-binding protein
MAVMDGGRIVQTGFPEEVMNRPVNEMVASFVGTETILNGKVMKQDGGTFWASVQGYEIEAVGDAPIGETVALCIRPENVTLSLRASKDTTSARNVFSGKIIKIMSMGLYYKVHLDCGFHMVAYVTNHSVEDLSLREGKEVSASFKATAIHVVRRTERGREY